MDKPFNPFNSISYSQSGLIKRWLLSLLAAVAFAASWFYPDIKNKLSVVLQGDEVSVTADAASKPGSSKSAGSGKNLKGGKEG
jgi:hypothetical protein